jgi:hypothetical protein
MRLIRRSIGSLVNTVVVIWAVCGCASGTSSRTSSSAGDGGAAGESEAGGAAGSGSDANAGGAAAGGDGGSVTRPPDADSGGISDLASPQTPDANVSASSDATAIGTDGSTPMGGQGGGSPSYDGQVAIVYGPEVGPVVKMDCPGDPTEGWTEYKDSFHVEHPYNVPTNTRFSIVDGVYNFWVFPNDKPHSLNAQGKSPRTEAAYGGTFDKSGVPAGSGTAGTTGQFTTGKRLYSADMMVEKSAIGSAFMQIHTTTTGGGPIGIRMQSNSDIVNNGSLTVVHGGDYPGGLVGKWFNYKATLDTATLQVQIFINNCLKSTYKGGRGDGNFYFKNGVYFCFDNGGCRTHYKNIHLYFK